MCASDEKSSKNTSNKRKYNQISIPAHIILDGQPPIFKCLKCSAKFKTKHHVKYHEFCSSDVKPYSCNTCSKTFTLEIQLKNHQLVHVAKETHVCEVCDKAFKESSKLKRHMTLHSDKRPFVCDECGKQFKTAASLKLHGVIHTGKRPYSCELCNKTFNNSSNLRKHSFSHSDERTHMCERCGKKFKQKLALTVHRRSHSHKRNFACKTCNRAFINNKDLKRHQLVHSDISSYSCGLCSVSFRRRDNLRRHIRNTHPDEEKVETIIKDKKIQGIERKNVDNPNAINVITQSPMCRKNENSCSENKQTQRLCINGPLKLAFKTSAFRRNYNINRNYTLDSSLRGDDDEDHEVAPPSRISHTRNFTPNVFTGRFSASNLQVDEFYDSKPYVIKNIKFRIPEDYAREEDYPKAMVPPSVVKETIEDSRRLSPITETIIRNDTEDTKEVTVAATSVIVNTVVPKNVHWRRRMSENITKQKL